MLTGGGTDDQCVKLAAELNRLKQRVILAGPRGRLFQKTIDDLAVPFHDTGVRFGKAGFILKAASLMRRENAQIVHGHHGRDLLAHGLCRATFRCPPKTGFDASHGQKPGFMGRSEFAACAN